MSEPQENLQPGEEHPHEGETPFHEGLGVLAMAETIATTDTDNTDDVAVLAAPEARLETVAELDRRIRKSIGGTNKGIRRPTQRGRYKDYRN